TYNRAKTITRLYNSLVAQTFKDFEWLIVDDGSSDDTESIVENFIHENRIPIRYIRKENGATHTAYNIGLEEAQGDLFIDVDSDDWLEIESLSKISEKFTEIEKDSGCAGIISLKSYGDGRIIGQPFTETDKKLSLRALELSGQGGERTLVFKTAIARKYPFPVIKGERFMTEGVVYDKFSDYTFLIDNRSITTCEYQEDGLSSNPKSLILKNPGGYSLYYRNRIDKATGIKELLGYIIRYNMLSGMYKGDDIAPYSGKHRIAVSLLKLINPLIRYYYLHTLN
ncbi:MAG: glycosyltransferase family 2 protein, partial [Muribaculaceae bacterium]|nr:glycosyltransferase family 2 protein [Muribaculaceae bacterium]